MAVGNKEEEREHGGGSIGEGRGGRGIRWGCGERTDMEETKVEEESFTHVHLVEEKMYASKRRRRGKGLGGEFEARGLLSL